MSKKQKTSKRQFKRGLMNRKYLKTEEAIIEVLLKSKEMPSTTELTRKAQISRATLYRHHRAIPGIVPDYEKEILIRYQKRINKLLKKKELDLKNLFLQSLIFVIRYKRIFRILFKYSGDRVVERMILYNKKIICQKCHLPNNSESTVKIFAKEVAGVIEVWSEKNFPEDELPKTLNNIIQLTREAKGRLGTLKW